MWLSCIEQPPPYGVAVTLKWQGMSNPVHEPYVRRRDKKGNKFTDYWIMVSGTKIRHRHESKIMEEYDWDASNADVDIDKYEIFEDD